MLERFNKLKICIKKALIDIGSVIIILDSDILPINNINFTLLPVKDPADATLSFMLENFNSDELVIKLKHSLECKINERRTDVSGTLQYLHNNEKSELHKLFTTPSKYTIVKVIERFAERLLFNKEMENLAADQSESDILENEIIERQTISNSQSLMQK